MILSNKTLEIFKNFSKIESRLHIHPGNQLVTEEFRGTRANVTVDETFPVEFIIYDLNKFLNIIAMFKDNYDIRFDKSGTFIEITKDNKVVRFVGSNDAPLITPEEDIKFNEEESVSFRLSKEEIGNIEKIDSILAEGEIYFTGDKDNIFLTIGDIKDEQSNTYRSECSDSYVNLHNAEFNVSLDSSCFSFIPGDYDVSICSGMLIRFKWAGNDSDLTYIIGLNMKSVYNHG